MARAALAVTYGQRNLSYTGPVATTFEIRSGELVISFSGATPPLRFLTIPKQTAPSQASQQGFELQAADGTWMQAPVVVSSPTSVTVKLGVGLPAVPVAVRYAWQPIPTTQLLYDSARIDAAELTGLPAPPFWANCSTDSCHLITPGTQLPRPGGHHPSPPPPDPQHPQCPRSPLPNSGGACRFSNNSRFVGATEPPRQVQVRLNDYDACCKACTAEPSCHAAAMTHGPKSAGYDFCELYSSVPRTKPDVVVVCPALAVTLVPVKTKAAQ
jgi:hypothetical protein